MCRFLSSVWVSSPATVFCRVENVNLFYIISHLFDEFHVFNRIIHLQSTARLLVTNREGIC